VKCLFELRYHLDDPAMHRRMIDTNVALSHHFLAIAKTQRVSNIPSRTQQDLFKRIVRTSTIPGASVEARPDLNADSQNSRKSASFGNWSLSCDMCTAFSPMRRPT
jgi:hypothetical protein